MFSLWFECYSIIGNIKSAKQYWMSIIQPKTTSRELKFHFLCFTYLFPGKDPNTFNPPYPFQFIQAALFFHLFIVKFQRGGPCLYFKATIFLPHCFALGKKNKSELPIACINNIAGFLTPIFPLFFPTLNNGVIKPLFLTYNCFRNQQFFEGLVNHMGQERAH